MKARLNIGSRVKLALGSTLASLGGLLMVLSPLVGWYSVPRPWEFPLGFSTGLFAGLGATLAISGLVDYRRGR